MSLPRGSSAPGPGPRALVFGYHTMGCVGFDALLRNGFAIPAVFTHRDDPEEEIWWDNVADRARSRGIPVHFPEKAEIKDPAFAVQVAGYRPDFIFSFYFRWLIPESVLRLAPKGALNLHGSLLPRYRGRAPVNWVLVNGETETGVSLHYMIAKPDAGDLVAQDRVEIAFDDTALTLFGKLEAAAGKMLDRTLQLLAEGRAPSTPLDLAGGSYFGGRTPADGRFAWSWPAIRIYNLVRAVTHPYPGAFTGLGSTKLFVWWAVPGAGASGAVPGTVVGAAPKGVDIATGDGTLRLVRCQLEGGPELPAAELFQTLGLAPGTNISVREEER